MNDETHTAEYDAGYRDGAAAVVVGVRAWCSINEIAEPPLDWEGLGEFLTRVIPPVESHDFRDRFCRERKGGGVEWQPGYRCLVCQPTRVAPSGDVSGSPL